MRSIARSIWSRYRLAYADAYHHARATVRVAYRRVPGRYRT